MRTIEQNDIILAEGRYYSMDCYKTKRNNNVLVVGAAGTGKTRSIVIPNLLQAYGSYIISDPKGELYGEYGRYFLEKGYQVKQLNFDNPANSCHYNFFHYIRNEKDIIKLAHMLSYLDEGFTGQDPFWDRSAEVLLTCIISYLWRYRPEEEQTLESVYKLIDCCRLDENDSQNKSAFDRIMEDVGDREPHSFTYKQYLKFRVGAVRTMKSVLITLTSKLGKYDTESINQMLAYDEINIASIGHERTAIFVTISDTERSMDDLANIFYTQAMNELCYEADNHCIENRLPLDVRFILDDFATNCKIDEFPRMISSVRSRGISAMLMIQAESQLEQGYGRDSSTIIGNCDTYIYMGGNDIHTAENVARRCDLPLNEILNMPVETNWIFRRGELPAYNRNFDLESFLKEKWKEDFKKDLEEEPEEFEEIIMEDMEDVPKEEEVVVALEDLRNWAEKLYRTDKNFERIVNSRRMVC